MREVVDRIREGYAVAAEFVPGRWAADKRRPPAEGVSAGAE